MAYHPLANDSGQTPERRRDEAEDLIEMLEGQEDTMSDRDRSFYREQKNRLEEYGLDWKVSTKQLFWLRDMKERVL